MILTQRKRFERAIKKQPNLIAYYPCYETSGTTCLNYAPGTRGSNNGTIGGTPAGIGTAGKLGRCIKLDGTDDAVDCGSNSAIKNIPSTSSFTFGGLFYVKDSVTAKFPLSSRSGSDTAANPGIDILINFGTSGRCQARVSDAVTFFDTTYTASHTAWHLVVGVIDQENNLLRLYVDGTERNNVSVASRANVVGSQNPFIGKRGTSFFDEKVQHVFMCSRALTASENLELARLAGVA